MKKGMKSWRELVIQRCALKIRFIRAWANYTSRHPTISCHDITAMLNEIEHLNDLINSEKPFDFYRSIHSACFAVRLDDTSRHIP